MKGIEISGEEQRRQKNSNGKGPKAKEWLTYSRDKVVSVAQGGICEAGVGGGERPDCVGLCGPRSEL